MERAGGNTRVRCTSFSGEKLTSLDPWKDYIANSPKWREYVRTSFRVRRGPPLISPQKSQGIHLDLSTTMYHAVKASGYRVDSPMPVSPADFGPSSVPSATILYNNPQYDATQDFSSSSNVTLWGINFDLSQQTAEDVEIDVPENQHPDSGRERSADLPQSASVDDLLLKSLETDHYISSWPSTIKPAREPTDRQFSGSATGSEHSSAANSGISTPSRRGPKRSRGDWSGQSDDEEDVDDLVTRINGLGSGPDKDSIVSDVLTEVSRRIEEMITGLKSAPSETSIRGLLDDTLRSLQVFLEQVNCSSSVFASTTDSPGKRMATPNCAKRNIPSFTAGGS